MSEHWKGTIEKNGGVENHVTQKVIKTLSQNKSDKKVDKEDCEEMFYFTKKSN